MRPYAAEEKSLLRSSLTASVIVFCFLVAAKLLNFLKKVLIGQLFGVSRTADAFFAASYLPYYFAIFFEGILFLVFLPLFSQVHAEKGKESANRLAAEIFIFLFFMTGLFAALAVWAAPWLVRQLVPGFSPPDRDLTCALLRILSLVFVLTSLTSLFKALNSYFEQYAWAASAPLVDTLVMIPMTLFFWKQAGIWAAAWGSVAGAGTIFLQQFIFFLRTRFALPKQRGSREFWFGKIFALLIPMGAIWGFQQIPMVILNRFGSGMWQGTISSLTIALTLVTVPMGLVSHTVLFAIFPSLTKQAADAAGSAKEIFFRTLRGGFLILIPAGFLLTVFARPVAALLFSGGGIWEEGTRRIANSLACFGWAASVLYADLFMTQSLIAVRRTLPAIFLCATRAILTYGFGYFLSSWWDYQGLALSFSLALGVNFLVLFPWVLKGSPFRGGWKELFTYSGKLVLASSPVFLMLKIVNRWYVSDWVKLPKVVLALGLCGAVCLFLVFYLWGLARLKVREMNSLSQRLKQGFIRKSWWLAGSTDEGV